MLGVYVWNHKWQRSEVVLGLSNANTALRPNDRPIDLRQWRGTCISFRVQILNACRLFVYISREYVVYGMIVLYTFVCILTIICFCMLSTAFGAVFGRHCWLLLGGWACLVPAFLQIKRLLVLQRTSPQKALCFIVFVKKLIHGTKLPLIADKRDFIYCIYSISKKMYYMYMYKNHNLQPSKRLSPPPSSFWWNGVFHAGYRATKSVERYGLWNLGFAG